MSISVLISAYQAEPYIEITLNSIFNQTYKDVEVIVVNNGCTDNTGLILDKLSLKHSNLSVITQNQKPIPYARNEAFLKSKGDYILFMDSDDALLPKTLETLYNCAITNDSDIVLYHVIEVKNQKGYRKNMYFDSENNISKDPLDAFFKVSIMPNPWSKLIKKDYILNNPINYPLNFNHAEDAAYSAVLYMHNPKISFVNDYLYYWYIHPEGMSFHYHDAPGDVILALDYIYRNLVTNNLFDLYKDRFKQYSTTLTNWIYSRSTKEFQSQLESLYANWVVKTFN